jgi:hypothetical protein
VPRIVFIKADGERHEVVAAAGESVDCLLKAGFAPQVQE